MVSMMLFPMISEIHLSMPAQTIYVIILIILYSLLPTDLSHLGSSITTESQKRRRFIIASRADKGMCSHFFPIHQPTWASHNTQSMVPLLLVFLYTYLLLAENVAPLLFNGHRRKLLNSCCYSRL
jgi:hypothetical protein